MVKLQTCAHSERQYWRLRYPSLKTTISRLRSRGDGGRSELASVSEEEGEMVGCCQKSSSGSPQEGGGRRGRGGRLPHRIDMGPRPGEPCPPRMQVGTQARTHCCTSLPRGPLMSAPRLGARLESLDASPCGTVSK